MTGEQPVEIPRKAWIGLIAMTLSASLILVDQTAVPLGTPEAVHDLHGSIDEGAWILTANILPLAAFMVLGGRLGDLLGLRKVFLAGAVTFTIATAFAAGSQDMTMMLIARAVQGLGAALMMPNGVAIVSATFPLERKGTALGVLAGGSAAFAAAGPVMGGLLTSIDWRLVFLINVPLALLTIVLTLRSVPNLKPAVEGSLRNIDYPGAALLALSSVGLIFGLSQLQQVGISEPITIVPLAVALIGFPLFALVELRARVPLLDLRLFRHLNFLASNLSQMLAGAIELGFGYLMPFFLLLTVGVDPAVAGIALIPGTIPIILAGPLAGRVFDARGGRLPMAVGFGTLVLSGIVLALLAPQATAVALIPGLLLQGLGLGIVLTVNDPVGLNAVPAEDQSAAAGVINTSEQLGGAIGITVLLAVELQTYLDKLYDRLGGQGIDPSPAQISRVKDFVLEAERTGIDQANQTPLVRKVFDDIIEAHVSGFQAAFYVSSGIALFGVLMALVLVRREDRYESGPVFTRRSRWVLASSGRSPGLTRHPPGIPGERRLPDPPGAD